MTRPHNSRRAFLKSSVYMGAWVLSIQLPSQAQATSKARAKTQVNLKPSPCNQDWCIYVQINADNSVTLNSPIMDMGQYMRTTGPMILAEEMDLDWRLIDFTPAQPIALARNDKNDVIHAYADINTGGSMAVHNNWDYLRKAGARAKQMLIQEAAARWDIPTSQIRCKNNFVFDSKSKRQFSYGELAEKASSQQVPDDSFKLKDSKDYTLIGTAKHNIDLLDIVTGKPIYGLDADIEGALQVVVDRAPAIGAEIASYDKKAALAINGVSDVIESPRHDVNHWLNGPEKIQVIAAGVAVVADTLWAAMKGKRALKTQWKTGEGFKNQDSEAQIKSFYQTIADDKAPAQLSKNDGDVDKGLAEADFVLEQYYEKPLLAHACMEPFNCSVELKKDSATVITGNQFPHQIATIVEEVSGIDALKVSIHALRMGGGFGRKVEGDYVREAVVLAHKIKKPIKVTWNRENEIERDMFGSACVARVRAGIKNGKLHAWHHRQSQNKGGAQDNNYPQALVPHYKSEICHSSSDIPMGAWRGPMHLQWAFAVESMYDELAEKLSLDPLQFRMNLLKDLGETPYHGYGPSISDARRMAACYQAAAKMADWDKKRPPGTALGIAGHMTHGSYCAFVQEVSVSKDKQLTLGTAYGAIDCGIAINPNHIRAQMEGGYIDGLNAALFNKITFEDSRVVNNNFDKLRWIKMKEAPITVESHIIKSDLSPTGVGEPPTAPAAAALANAIYAASGQRIRRLPISESISI
ncbi:MAG: hypothetical protein COA42_01915 [Alteromonadaceae bacterium]|nr:MAG: hypothetical protein COA42_01915 [Alteromonadaceae bacterium]